MTTRTIRAILLVLSALAPLGANNLTISTPVLTGKNASAGLNNSANYVFVKFTVSWENSWRTSSAPDNWDAAWLYVKYRVGSGPWQHGTLSTSGHTAPSGSTISASSDGKGAFIYRSSDGSGSVNFADAKLRWNYGADGVPDSAQVTVRVMGIEMVYVPQGTFSVGSGSTGDASFTNGSWTTGASIPYSISSEGAITIAQTSGNLWAVDNSVLGGSGLGSTGTLAAAFPKGYDALYVMKYSITQEQYRDFLNMLTYDQQATRTANAPNSAVGTLAMSSSASRNGIRIKTSGTASSVPAVYGCDASENGTFDESVDGQNLSCNWLSWADGIAFSDWTGLRPMTELEFEKACRGTATPVAGEFAWGTTSATAATATTNNRQDNEAVSAPSGANANFGSGLGYPIRVGIFAGTSTTRAQAGATYYGVMDMSGDVVERAVTIGNTTGRGFTGSHGDGTLDASGNMTGNSDWPGTDAVGAGFRGGPWDSGSSFMRISDRTIAALTSSTRGDVGTRGFRAVRTAP